MTTKTKSERLTEAVEKIDDGLSMLREIADEIEGARDNMSGTNLENTERYQRYDEAAEILQQAVDDIENARDEAESVELN